MVVARIAVEMDHPTLILTLGLELHLPSQVMRPASFCILNYTPYYGYHLVYSNWAMMVVLLILSL